VNITEKGSNFPAKKREIKRLHGELNAPSVTAMNGGFGKKISRVKGAGKNVMYQHE